MSASTRNRRMRTRTQSAVHLERRAAKSHSLVPFALSVADRCLRGRIWLGSGKILPHCKALSRTLRRTRKETSTSRKNWKCVRATETTAALFSKNSGPGASTTCPLMRSFTKCQSYQLDSLFKMLRLWDIDTFVPSNLQHQHTLEALGQRCLLDTPLLHSFLCLGNR